jgi:hypothetical protein
VGVSRRYGELFFEQQHQMAKTKFVQMQKTFFRLSEIRAIFHSGAQESPGALKTKNIEKKRGKNMSATDTKKATAATSETMDEVFHEAMRS